MTLMPGIAEAILHDNWGYPYRGSKRRRTPAALLGIHITGNSSLPSARAEVIYSARTGSGASFTFANNRNGTIVQAMHPETSVPWTMGDLKSPLTGNPIVKALASQSIYNPNEYFGATVENVGFEPGYPLTPEQELACAKELVFLHGLWPAIPLDTIHIIGHREINTVTRWNCPTRGDLDSLKARIVNKARALLEEDTDVDVARPDIILRELHTASRASIAGGQTYNAFQFLGRDKNGNPLLRRFNALSYPNNTSARVIYIAALAESDKAGFMVSDWAYLPGHGNQPFVWWSRDPLKPPTLIEYEAGGITQEELQRRVRAARRAGAKAAAAAVETAGTTALRAAAAEQGA